MNFNDINEIRKAGFTGFKSIRELYADPSILPSTRGVYLVLNCDKKKPVYLTIGTGGHFKGRNPNVSIQELENNWLTDSLVIYIGKAGGIKSKATLKSRLRQYLKFGQGHAIGHWGGRYIWQLAFSGQLIVCWKTLPDEDPRSIEAALILDFADQFGKRPFANLAN